MTVYLVYSKDRIEGNEVFIRRLTDGLAKRNIEAKTVMAEDFRSLPLPDAAVMRTFDDELAFELQKKGIRTFNCYKTQSCAYNKCATLGFARSCGVPVIKSFLCNRRGEPPFFPPFVVKELFGHGGEGVYLVHSDEEFVSVTANMSEDFLVQECAEIGKDRRLYCLGEEVVLAMERTNDHDFRSNYKLGGSARAVQPTEQECEYAKRLIKGLKSDYVGVDFVYVNGQPVLNEIEDIVGCRMVYENTDIDLIDRFAEYISKRI